MVAREEVGLMNVRVAFFGLGMHTENIAEKKKWSVHSGLSHVPFLA